ncbi:MAG TPA: histidine phosphotransferase family protein, partial [Caulobacteraceae bacterium]
PRVAIKDEVRSGLAGEAYAAGLAGRWAPAAFVAMLAASAGGTIAIEPREGGVRFALSLPPGA